MSSFFTTYQLPDYPYAYPKAEQNPKTETPKKVSNQKQQYQYQQSLKPKITIQEQQQFNQLNR